MLRFPYHDGLRRLLRTIPGRRWDAEQRAWRIPLDPDRAEALSRLMRALHCEPEVSEDLARRMRRLRASRDPRECVVDLARPDEKWWFSFAIDRGGSAVSDLLEHAEAVRIPVLARAVLPLDLEAASLIGSALAGSAIVRLTEDAEHALTELAGHDAEPAGDGVRAFGRAGRAGDRRAQASSSAHRQDLHREDLGDAALIDAHDRRWHGTIDVTCSPEQPSFLLLGDRGRLPESIRGLAASDEGGASLPLTLESWEAIEGVLRGWITAAAKRCVQALREGRPAPGCVLELSRIDEQRVFVLAPGHDRGQVDAFASLPGVLRRHGRGGEHEHRRLPALSADPFWVPTLDAFLAEHDVWVDPDALCVLQEIRQQHAVAAGVVALSVATEATLELPALAGQLKPFQKAGVRYLLAQRRAFLADEQGLGKTIEALATIEADQAFPAIVLCPASLKLNWLREARRWLPSRKIEVLAGTSGALGQADIIVVNYEILAARIRQLSAIRARALILDESHYCKNARAKRTQAAHRLAGTVAPHGLVLALTGTPVINRPRELVSQLRILGRLADFGSGAELGRRFDGADGSLRLHWHLRARCFVRRLKVDVLPQLPPKTRAVVPLTLDNEPEYRLAERDLVAWLRTQPLDLRAMDAKVAAALRAERLVRLNALKLLAAEGKLHGALAWIHDFLSSGERLVVFARHRKIQAAVIERFPDALHIVGQDSHAARDAAVSAFQGPDSTHNRLIVCSIEIAGQGLTLTRSSNVAFLELDWTPARHDQAEDRCHRIGQKDAVNASYLLAAGTIDETIATLLERKRAVIDAVTDGRRQDEEDLIDALVRELRSTPYRHLRAVA